MQELKIRVWDGLFKEFKTFDNYFCKAKDGILSVCVNNDDITLDLPTGLKDRNGKEIYEGDIVRVSYGYNYEVRQFRTGAWRIGRDDLYVWADSSEVIGNIHENPEILEKEK